MTVEQLDQDDTWQELTISDDCGIDECENDADHVLGDPFYNTFGICEQHFQEWMEL